MPTLLSEEAIFTWLQRKLRNAPEHTLIRKFRSPRHATAKYHETRTNKAQTVILSVSLHAQTTDERVGIHHKGPWIGYRRSSTTDDGI